MPDPDSRHRTVAAKLIAALTDGRQPPLAVLEEHSRQAGWGVDELQYLMHAFDAAEAAGQLPEPVLSTVRSALQRWSRASRNGATDRMPALVDAGDSTEEMPPPDDVEDTSEIAPPPAVTTRPAPAAFTPSAAPRTAPAAIEPGVMLLGRYEVQRRLGRGGTAVVHLARDLRRDDNDGDDAYVAIKSPRPDAADPDRAVARLKREFRQTRMLSHPNVVRMHDLDRDGELWFITMERLDGESLVDLVQRAAPLPLADVLPIARACAQALAYAHGRGIVHGDFKPSNVMIGANGAARLLDFGAAPDSTSSDDVEAGEDLRRFATRCYASPETLAGDAPTPRDDVFSLACVVYELLSGSHPFQRQGADAALAAGAVVQPLAALTPAQNDALARGLAWRRDDRPFGVLELLDALEAATAATPAEAISVVEPTAASATAPTADASVPALMMPLRVPSIAVANDASHEPTDAQAPPTVTPAFGSDADAAPAPCAATPATVTPPAAATVVAPALAPRLVAKGVARATDVFAALEALLGRYRKSAATPSTVASTVARVTSKHAASRPGFPTLTLALATAVAIGFLLFLPLRDPAPEPVPPSAGDTVPVAPTGLPPSPHIEEQTEAVAPVVAVPAPVPANAVAAPRVRIAFDATSVKVEEDAFAAVLNLRRSGNVRSAARAAWRISAGSAEPGRDFAGPLRGTVRFAAGQTLRTLYVPMMQDREPEAAESFAVTLHSAGSDVALGPVHVTEVTIADDD